MPKKKKKKKKKPSLTRTIAHAQVELLKAENRRAMLSKLRTGLPLSSYDPILQWIHSNTEFEKSIFGSPLPSTPSDFKIEPPMSKIKLENEIQWGWSYLSLFLEQISYFCEKSIEFENSVLLGDFEFGFRTLDDIENKLGVSLWLIKNRISLLQAAKGLEAQKVFANTVQNETDPIISFIIYYISYRTEPAVSPNKFVDNLTDIFSNLRIPTALKDYLSFHIMPGHMPDFEDISNVLIYESSGSVIDYYISTLTLASNIICSHNEKIRQNKVLPKKDSFLEFNDSRLKILKSITGENFIDDGCIHEAGLKAFEQLITGNHDEVLKIYDSILHGKNIQDFNIIEIVGQSLSINESVKCRNEDVLINKILNLIASAIKKDDEVDKSIFELLKISWNFISLPWAQFLLDFVISEISDTPFVKENGRSISSEFTSRFINPIRIMDFPPGNLRRKYSELIEYAISSDYIKDYIEICVDEENDSCELYQLPEEVILLQRARNSYLSRNFGDSLNAATNLVKSNNKYYTHQSIRLISNCYIKLGRVKECIDYMVDEYIANKNILRILPFEDAVNNLNDETINDLRKNISFPIIYDIIVKKGEIKYEKERAYAYEDFLLANNLERPSQLENVKKKFGQNKLVYYLNNLCVEQVMDSSIFFDSSDDIANERVSVCSLLTELDHQNSDVYNAEIRKILRRQALRKKFKEIEQSKIYVDLESIKKVAEINLRENYNRYIAFLKDGIDDLSLALSDAARESFDKGDIEKLLSLVLPTNEINSLFESIIVELRDEFVTSPEHGLDKYLSVRIRHGTLSSHLRSPLENENLITQKDSIDGDYKESTYWSKIISNEDNQNDVKEILESIKEFSQKFDKLIEKILQDWIQIKVDPKHIGVFDFTIIKSQIPVLATIVNEETKFSKFLDDVFDYFCQLLEVSLKNMRDRIRNEAKKEANEMLNDLQRKIEEYNYPIDTGELIRSINRGRTNLMLAFDRVIEWFRYIKSTEKKPFLIEDVIKIAETSVQLSNKNFRIDFNISNEMKKLYVKGKFASFVDILFIIFENIIRHSAIKGIIEAVVNLEYKNKKIIIQVSNKLGKNVSKKENIEKIARLKDSIEQREYGEKIKKEGGTGFYKIKQILSHDFTIHEKNNEPILEFGFNNEDNFVVLVGIPIKKEILQ